MLRNIASVRRRRARAARLEVERLESREVLATTTPSTPLNDLGTGTYNGQEGGLYPNGTDVRPAALETTAEATAAQIQPLDANGNVNTSSGMIGFISVGMSNASDEFNGDSNAFEPRANADPSKNSKLAVVNCAQSGKDAADWADPNNSAWTTALSRLTSAGLTAKQVEVVWLKEAEKYPENIGTFLPAAQALQSDLESIARNIKTYFPNAKITYLSSRTHAFTTTGLNPEPYAFESGFAVKWTIQDQINGVGNLNYDPSKGPVVAPLLSWGSYLWANGTSARSDGFTWVRSDTASDATHPSASGIQTVADMLLAFFKTDPTTTPWFLRPATAGEAPTVTVTASQTSGASGLSVNFTATATAHDGGSITEYAWTYDDGDFAYGATPTKIFYAPGTYNVHLAVTDDLGNVTLATIAITISGGGGHHKPPPPVRFSDATATAAATPAWANLPNTATAGNDAFQMAVPADLSSLSLTAAPPSQAVTTPAPAATQTAAAATALSGAATAAKPAPSGIFNANAWMDPFAAL